MKDIIQAVSLLAFALGAFSLKATPIDDGTWISVKDPAVLGSHVATGDGSTDDTDNINYAIRTAASLDKNVYFPPSIYIINSVPNYDNPIRTQSGVKLFGESPGPVTDPSASILRLPNDPTSQGHLLGHAIIEIGDPNYTAANQNPDNPPRPVQQYIIIQSLGFDLVNDYGRKAIKVRYPAQHILIDHCNGFQSDLVDGQAPLQGVGLGPKHDQMPDNHFFSMSYGSGNAFLPKDRLSDVYVQFCHVSNSMQLTADGQFGVIGLSINNNTVDDASTSAIAVTTIVQSDCLFDNIWIYDNTIHGAAGSAITVGPDSVDTRTYDFTTSTENGLARNYSLHHLYIFNNDIEVGAHSMDHCVGIGVGAMILGSSDIYITNNTIVGAPGHGDSVALDVKSDDFSWSETTFNGPPVIAASAFNPSDPATGLSLISVGQPHNLLTGMLVQIYPASNPDGTDGTSTLPAGIEPYKFYVVNQVSSTSFSLSDRTGNPVTFGAPPPSGSYQFRFKPVIERLYAWDNTISGPSDPTTGEDPWSRDIYDYSSLDCLYYNNHFPDRISIIGEHENLVFADNICGEYISIGNPPDNSPWPPGEVTLRNSSFIGNTWTCRDNPPFWFNNSAISFNPGGINRIMEYTFAQNHIEVLGTTPSGNHFKTGVRDQGAIGTVHAIYADNSVDTDASEALNNPNFNGFDCDSNNVIFWQNNLFNGVQAQPNSP